MRLYQSEPMKIGKHHWRIAVNYFDYLRANCTVYEWSRDGIEWNNYRQWHDYDFNGSWGPKSLTTLFKMNLPRFQHLIEREGR